MSPTERAARLSRQLQAEFRIDLFSGVVERSFERRLAEAIVDAERAAYLRGRDTAAANPGPVTGPAAPYPTTPSPGWNAGEAEARTS